MLTSLKIKLIKLLEHYIYKVKRKIVIEYFISEIKISKIKVLQCYIWRVKSTFHISVVINDDDERAENILIFTEAKLNSLFKGISSYTEIMVYEESDNYKHVFGGDKLNFD